jgi:hypothetical protein
MSEFQKNDKFWSIDVYMECGTIFDVDKTGYGIIHDPSRDRKRRATAKTKEECINDMISQLEKLRDFPSDY